MQSRAVAIKRTLTRLASNDAWPTPVEPAGRRHPGERGKPMCLSGTGDFEAAARQIIRQRRCRAQSLGDKRVDVAQHRHDIPQHRRQSSRCRDRAA